MPGTQPKSFLLHRLLTGSFKGDPEAQAKCDLLAEICGSAALRYATQLLQPRAIVPPGRIGKAEVPFGPFRMWGSAAHDSDSVWGAKLTKVNASETKTTFAARVGLTKGRISQLLAQGLPVRPDGQINVAEGLAWIEDNLDPSRRNKGGAFATPTSPVRVSTTLAEAKRLHKIVKVQRAKRRSNANRVSLLKPSPQPARYLPVPVPNATRTWLGCNAPLLC